MSAGRDSSSSDHDEPLEGTPYRALLSGGPSFDLTIREDGGALVLQAVTGEDETGAPREPVTYRFEQTREAGHALLVANGRSVPLTITEAGAGEVRVTIGGRTQTVQVKGETALLLERFGIAESAGAGEAEVQAPMPGLVVRVLVSEGDEVNEGDGLLVLEAMKMENELRAPAAGTVAALHTEEGASADKGAVLVEIE
ncbi:MAG: acetyl-CoA carboxylase biotin carboxyl carrier protein subunit [Bacteroidetes bacterium QS_9_68_14]|nr:MAG: acetyl-CoA carboxylase biotin carboxyl carrier protein subunit [Bacteroidetes bacterium QS_9_68_14]